MTSPEQYRNCHELHSGNQRRSSVLAAFAGFIYPKVKPAKPIAPKPSEQDYL
jgi:hypothetical protein